MNAEQSIVEILPNTKIKAFRGGFEFVDDATKETSHENYLKYLGEGVWCALFENGKDSKKRMISIKWESTSDGFELCALRIYPHTPIEFRTHMSRHITEISGTIRYSHYTVYLGDGRWVDCFSKNDAIDRSWR